MGWFVVTGTDTLLQHFGTNCGLQLQGLCQSVSTAPVHVRESATFTVTELVVDPAEFVAVTEYDVVCAGETVMLGVVAPVDQL
jgi:hypothetical protein